MAAQLVDSRVVLGSTELVITYMGNVLPFSVIHSIIVIHNILWVMVFIAICFFPFKIYDIIVR
jgi:hypothetical protein